MAYVNVLEWKAEQVAEWLHGLDDSIYPYAHYFINNNVTGRGLLNVTVDDLYKLHVEKLGHQEIILEGLEHLRNLHHNLDTENLQYVCLKLSCKARSLFNELRLYGPGPNEVKQKISTASMSAAADVLDALWTLVTWLDRPPFKGQQHYEQFKATFLKIGVELATSSQRDTFAEKPVNVIKGCCEELANLSDTLIRDVNDPIILQPASLDIATAKRRTEDENFGLVFDNSASSGVHMISEVKFQSPAHQCGRIQPGDEIVQINYQTVVGWNLKKVLQLMNENPSELILTLKKRPRHLPVFGQIYMKPFRIPARKNEKSHYFNNLPSPRAELLVAPNITFPVHKPKVESDEADCALLQAVANSESDEEQELDEGDDEDDCGFETQTGMNSSGFSGSNDMLAGQTGKSPTQSMRSVLSRPRSVPQRRATISGSSPSHFKPYINITEIWSHIPKSTTADGGSKASTLRSSDSGHATLEEGSMTSHSEEVLRRTEHKHGRSSPHPRPQTVSASNFSNHYIDFSDPDYVSIFVQKPPIFCAPAPPAFPAPSPPLSLNASLVSETEYVNLESEFGDLFKRQPVPKPRKQSTKEEYQNSPNRKKPIPQPRKISSSNLCDNAASKPSPAKVELTASNSFRNFLPESKKEVCPVPTAQFKSYKRFTAEPSPSQLPDYVNTTPPPPPANPPPPLEPRGPARHLLKSTSASNVGVAMRHKSNQQPPEQGSQLPPLPHRYGLVLDPTNEARARTSSSEIPSESSTRTPYYMSDVYRAGSPEKKWIESLRKAPGLSPVSDKNKKGRGYVQCDPAEVLSQSPPPPVPERHYEVPYHPRLPKPPTTTASNHDS